MSFTMFFVQLAYMYTRFIDLIANASEGLNIIVHVVKIVVDLLHLNRVKVM